MKTIKRLLVLLVLSLSIVFITSCHAGTIGFKLLEQGQTIKIYMGAEEIYWNGTNNELSEIYYDINNNIYLDDVLIKWVQYSMLDSKRTIVSEYHNEYYNVSYSFHSDNSPS